MISKTNVIWVVFKHENVENFEGEDAGHRKTKEPMMAFKHLEQACKYILEAEPVISYGWKLVMDSFDHIYGAGIQRHLEYERDFHGHTYCKDIYMDVLPVELEES